MIISVVNINGVDDVKATPLSGVDVNDITILLQKGIKVKEF